MSNLVEIQNLSVSFRTPHGQVHALRDINLDIPDGEFTVLVGPSGCGKTTCLRVAAGLEPIQEGRVEIAGVEVARSGFSVPPERRRVGLMFQDYALFPHLRVVDNVAFGVREGDRAAKRHAAMELLARLGVERYAKDYPHVLSGGEQQMLAIGRALMSRPKLILFDEPSLGLAPNLVKTTFEIVSEIRSQGVTVLMVEQNAFAALKLCDRSYLLESGKITLEGTGTELKDDPYVREAYLGG